MGYFDDYEALRLEHERQEARRLELARQEQQDEEAILEAYMQCEEEAEWETERLTEEALRKIVAWTMGDQSRYVRLCYGTWQASFHIDNQREYIIGGTLSELAAKLGLNEEAK